MHAAHPVCFVFRFSLWEFYCVAWSIQAGFELIETCPGLMHAEVKGMCHQPGPFDSKTLFFDNFIQVNSTSWSYAPPVSSPTPLRNHRSLLPTLSRHLQNFPSLHFSQFLEIAYGVLLVRMLTDLVGLISRRLPQLQWVHCASSQWQHSQHLSQPTGCYILSASAVFP